MKIRPIFESHQKLITQFANSRLGRWYLKAENLPILKVSPDGITYLQDIKGDRIIKKSIFYSKSPYLKKFRGAIEFIVKAGMLVPYAMNPEALWYPAFSLTTSTFNPDADPETTSCDGIIRSSTSAIDTTSWSNVRNMSSPATGSTFASYKWVLNRIGHNDNLDGTATGWRAIDRGFYGFDTSSIDSGDTIDSADFSVKPSLAPVDDFDTSGDMALSEATPSSDTSLSTGDWTNWNSTEFVDTRPAVTDFSLNTYYDFSLNSSGLSNIDKSGVSQFFLTVGFDFDNSAPTPNPSTNGDENCGIWNYAADNVSGGTSDAPKLTVVHSAGGTVETGSVSPATLSLSSPTQTATYQAVIDASVSPAVLNITAPSTTADHEAIHSGSVSPATLNISSTSTTPTYIYAINADVLPAKLTLSTSSLSPYALVNEFGGGLDMIYVNGEPYKRIGSTNNYFRL